MSSISGHHDDLKSYGTLIANYVPILAIFVYFGHFPAYFGPFRKVQSQNIVETLESASDPAIESYAYIYPGNRLGAHHEGRKVRFRTIAKRA